MGIGNKKQPVVDDFARGMFGIAGEVVGVPRAIKEFVTKETALGIEDRLTSEETIGDGDGSVRIGWRRSGSGFWRRSYG
jgi:hypothetical protein